MDLTAAADYFWQAQPGSFWKAPRSAQDDTVRATYGIKLRTKQSMPCGVGTHFSVSTLIRQAFGRASLEELPSRVQGARVARPDQDPWWSTHVAPRWAVAGQTDSSSVAPRDHWVSTLPKPASTKGTPTRSQAVPSDSASAQGLGG